MTLDIPVVNREVVPLRMRSRIDDAGGVTALRLSGEIDASEATELETSVLRALSDSEGLLHLDLSEVTFLDCAGMSAIIRSIRAAARSGSQVLMVSPAPRVRKLFAMSGNGRFLGSSGALVDVTIAATVASVPKAGGAG